jgi:hypothetical protein
MSSEFEMDEVFLMWGGADLEGIPLVDANVKLRSSGGLPSFGISVFPLGDINADGDVDIGVSGYARSASDLQLFYGPFDVGGTFNADTEVDVTLRGDGEDDDYYRTLKNVGDVTGDSVPDLLVGTPYSGGTSDPTDWYRGIAYIVPGFGM